MWHILFLVLVIVLLLAALFFRSRDNQESSEPKPPEPEGSPEDGTSPDGKAAARVREVLGDQMEEIGSPDPEILEPLASSGTAAPQPLEAAALEEVDVFEETSYFEERHFSLKAGEMVLGKLRELDRGSFNLYVLDSKNYGKFSAGEEYRSEMSRMGARRLELKFRAPAADTWYFVFEMNRKLHPRVINLELKKLEKTEDQ